MKTIKLFLFGSVIILFGATSCIEDFTISGNGIAATEGRITLDFTEVQSEGEFDVHITHGDEFEVVVNAESNVLPYIETNVNRDKLRIYIRGLHNVKNRLPMEIYITTPYIEGITQSGSGIITTDYFTTDDMEVKISGSGRIETAVDAFNIDAIISGSGVLDLSGTSNNGDFLVSGSGKINANDLSLRNCEASISGSGNMWVSVENHLKASISGSGSVYYSGNPSVEKHISGSGNVIPYN